MTINLLALQKNYYILRFSIGQSYEKNSCFLTFFVQNYLFLQ